MRKHVLFLLSLLLIASMLLGACQSADTEAPAAEEPAAEEPMTEEPAAEEPAAGDVVRIRWFVGLGAGSDEGTFEAQEAVVAKFNETHDNIELVLEIVDNDAAYDTLATQIAGGNAPDIVGPVGIRGRDTFFGAWLDLDPLIEANNYDLSSFDPAMVEFYQVKEQGQLGIPFGIFPSFVLFNLDLFDEAGLPYPPAEYGQPYIDENGNELEWNTDTLRELAMKLTVDANGNDALSPDFDPNAIVQFGWMNQWTDPRGIGTMFGAGSFTDENGDAQIPEQWYEAWEWTYKGWWEDWFIPNGPYGGAEFLQGPGGPFSSGNLAMIHMHTWYMAPWALGDVGFDWDMGATPSHNGVVTSKMHADTFGILKGTKNPDAAFEVLTFLLSEEIAPELLNIYGGMPARLELQESWLDNYFVTNFPDKDLNTDVIIAGMAYADNPNHESWMPSFLETTDRYNEFWNKLANESGLDFDAEVELLRNDLQAIFDAAQD